jgi:ELWxxDGT repeat protein
MAAPLGDPQLVADLQPGPHDAPVGFGGVVNDRLIFRTGAPGPYKLWSVAEGQSPVLLGEFENTLRFDTYATFFESEFYFAADDGESGLELWKTDGTPGSVTRVADLYPGGNHGLPSFLTVFNGALFFAGSSPAGHGQLWKIESPGQAPVSVENFRPGSFISDINVIILGQLGDDLYLSVNDVTNGRELWKTDGTAGGAVMVKNIASGSSSSEPQWFTAMQGIGYFSAQANTAQGYELWRTDGTEEGTWLVGDFSPQASKSTLPRYLTVWNDRLYFAARSNSSGERLLSTDGTSAGTVEVKNFGGSQTSFGVRQIFDLQVFNDQLVFRISDRTGELWRSDGTAAGTERLTPYVDGDDFGIGILTAIDNLLYFPAGGSERPPGVELWVSDATAAGTQMLAEINPGTRSSEVGDLVNAAGVIYLFAEDNLYRVDPITRVPKYLGNFDTARELTAVGSSVYFTANNIIGLKSLYKVDGETVRSVDFKENGSFRAIAASNLIAMGNELYFSAKVFTTSGEELWKTDGTTAGTVLVADINPGVGNSGLIMGAAIGGFVYFAANDGVHGIEWWKSDGTMAGTQLLADINPGAASGWTSNASIMGVGSRIFFRANDGAHGDELWSISPAGGIPYLVSDIVAGAGASSPAWFTPLERALVFTANGGTGREVWMSDGTAEGTIKLSNVNPGSSSIGPVTLTASGGYVYFGVDSATAGSQLWKTDGTVAGTSRVKQISVGIPNGIVAAADHDGILYFSATDADGNELWRSDGTLAGTYQVADLAPGSAQSNPRELLSVGSIFYFIGENYEVGREIWFIASPSALGDFNFDGFVDQADYDFWRANYGANSGVGLQADGNGDGVVGAADYVVWRNGHAAYSARASVQASAAFIADAVVSASSGSAMVGETQQSVVTSTSSDTASLELIVYRELCRAYQIEMTADQSDVRVRDAAFESMGDRKTAYYAAGNDWRRASKSDVDNELIDLDISHSVLRAISSSSLKERFRLAYHRGKLGDADPFKVLASSGLQ